MTTLEPAVGALVLAAGASTRLGRPKQLVAFDGLPLVTRAARAALEAGAAPVVVVLGANASVVRAALDGVAAETVLNPRWRDGMGTSLAAGLNALLERAPDVRGVLVTLADQPLVDGRALGRLLGAWEGACADARRSGHEVSATIAAATYGEVTGVPAVFGRAHFDEIRALPAAAGAATLLRGREAHVRRVPMPEGAVDVDTEADLIGLLSRQC